MVESVESDYPFEWEKYLKDGHKKPESWMRGGSDIWRDHADRSWLYENVIEPVLDIGCGTCIDASGFGEEYVGLDITPSFLHAARFIYGVHNLVLADGRCLPFRDKSFKTAYAKSLLLHYLLSDMFRFIEELCRVGETAYIVWDKSHMPSDITSSHKTILGFWWFRPSLSDIQKRFWLDSPKKGTSITEVKPR